MSLMLFLWSKNKFKNLCQNRVYINGKKNILNREEKYTKICVEDINWCGLPQKNIEKEMVFWCLLVFSGGACSSIKMLVMPKISKVSRCQFCCFYCCCMSKSNWTWPGLLSKVQSEIRILGLPPLLSKN